MSFSFCDALIAESILAMVSLFVLISSCVVLINEFKLSFFVTSILAISVIVFEMLSVDFCISVFFVASFSTDVFNALRFVAVCDFSYFA